jgi:hypothetical protein
MRFSFTATVLGVTRHVIVHTARLLAVVGLVPGLLLAALPAPGAAQPLTFQDVITQNGAIQDFTVQEFPGQHLADVTNPPGGTLWAPPSPQAPAPRYNLSFTRLQCVKEGGGWLEQIAASDEPYVLIYVVNLRSPSSGHAFRSRVFDDVDSGENRSQTIQVWGSVLSNPDDLIVLVQIMEHDEGDVEHLFQALNPDMNEAAKSAVAAGLGRDGIVSRLKGRMQSLIDRNRIGERHGSFNMDDQIGGVQELRITVADTVATAIAPVQKSVEARDSSDGHYRAHFELRRQ